MKRILINATHAEEIRVALCNGTHLYDFDLENRTREQKKANIYKGHVTRVEPSLEAVFVEYGSARQGFLPIREIASDYLSGDPRSGNIKNVIKEGDELIVQIEKEERGNKGAALSTFVSLAGRYLVLMPNNPRGGGISRQISGKLRDEMKQILANLHLPKGMSVIIRTAGIGKSSEDLQQDLDHLLTIWKGIQEQNKKYPSPRLVHQEAGVVTRAVRDYLRDDIAEIWVDNENAYNEVANFIEAVMPQQASKLRKYTDFEPMFARFGIEKQIETAYQREVRLPSGGSIVIDQTEALVSIDINSSKATKGSDISETAYNTNLEAADEIARQLRLRDMGGLIVIDFIDMASSEHQKAVENRIREATKNDRARIQFAEISRFGLLEMSRQRLRPSLEEATGFPCPRCHGNGMIRDLRSLALSIMRQIEQKALQERQGEVQAEVPTEIAAFLLNEKRDSLVYLEQDSGVRITILPHAHLESPNFNLTYDREGFAPTSYERISESEQNDLKDRGYDTNWHTEHEVLESHVRQTPHAQKPSNAWAKANHANNNATADNTAKNTAQFSNQPQSQAKPQAVQQPTQPQPVQTSAVANTVAWLSNLFAPTQQASLANAISSQEAAQAIESIVNTGVKSLGVYGQLPAMPAQTAQPELEENRPAKRNDYKDHRAENRAYKDKKDRPEKEKLAKTFDEPKAEKVENKEKTDPKSFDKAEQKSNLPKREPHSKRDSRGEKERKATLTPPTFANTEKVTTTKPEPTFETATQKAEPKPNLRNETVQPIVPIVKSDDPNTVQMHVIPVAPAKAKSETIQLSLDGSKTPAFAPVVEKAEKAPTPTPQTAKTKPSQTTDVTHEVKVVSPDMVNGGATVAEKVVLAPVAEKAVIEEKAIEPKAVEAEVKPLANTPMANNVVGSNTALPTPVADIHVTASLPVVPEQGRAKNDPREVYKLFMQNSSVAKAETAIPAVVPTVVAQTAHRITGTVGQFIEQHLPDTVKDSMNVVSHFLEAMTIFGNANNGNAQSQATQAIKTLAPVISTAESSAKFDDTFGKFFRNYGFTAVTQADIDRYHSLRQPENRYECEAGTNHSQPTPPTHRASNDPRGSIVNQPTTSVTPVASTAVAEKVAEVAPSKTETTVEPTATEKPAKTKAPKANPAKSAYTAGSVGAWIVEKLGATGENLIAEGNLVTAFLQASQTTTQTGSANDVEPKQATAPQPSELSEEDLFKENLFKTKDDTKTESDDDSNQKPKTTAASYKNMIESVAEQMSMGGSTLLKLSTAKPVAKTRVRKEKTPDKVAIKVPAKTKTRTSKKAVESAVVVKVVKKEPEPTETPSTDDSSAS